MEKNFKVGDTVRVTDWGQLFSTDESAACEYRLERWAKGVSWKFAISMNLANFPFKTCKVIRPKDSRYGYAIEAPDGKQYIIRGEGLELANEYKVAPSPLLGELLYYDAGESSRLIGELGGFKIYKTKKTTMSKILTFVKNLALSADEKVLRAAGLKTDCGDYTQEAVDVLLQDLCVEKEARLVEIAKKVLADNKEVK